MTASAIRVKSVFNMGFSLAVLSETTSRLRLRIFLLSLLAFLQVLPKVGIVNLHSFERTLCRPMRPDWLVQNKLLGTSLILAVPSSNFQQCVDRRSQASNLQEHRLRSRKLNVNAVVASHEFV